MIKIYTFGSHRADFIGLQMHSFRKHLREEFEFIVFNNSQFGWSGRESYGAIHEQGRQLGIPVIDVQKDQDLINRSQAIEFACTLFNPQGQYSNANVAHAYALRWAWENYISKERCPIALFDSDVFLIQPTKLTDTLNPHQLANIPDGKPHPDGRAFMYMWPTFVLADLARMPQPETLNWWCGRIEGVPVDVGGQTYHYFQAHPELDIYHIPRAHSPNEDSCPVHPADYDEFYLKDATVLHYRSGSNWNHQTPDYHAKKTEWLKARIG